MAAITLFEASVFNIKGYFRWKWASSKAETSRFLSLLKAFLYTLLK